MSGRMSARPPSDLPPFPDGSKRSFQNWTSWAKRALSRRHFEVLEQDVLAPDERVPLAWRSLLAAAAGLEASPDATYLAAQRFLIEGPRLEAAVFRAGELLVERSMRQGSTTPDVLYLAAAFAWPLEALSPRLSRHAWAYLVDAPWQTSSVVLVELVTDLVRSGPPRTPRRLLDLAHRRLEHGPSDSAAELLEAMVLAWSGKPSLSAIATAKDLRKAQAVPDIEEALAALARLYVERGDTTVHAREVLRRAAGLEATLGGLQDLEHVLTHRVWDRPLVETYALLEDAKVAAFEAQLAAALDAGQPHHARRLAESLLARQLDRRLVGDPQANVDKALRLFAQVPIEKLAKNREARVAAEQLATLYARTNYATELTRGFARRLVMEPLFTGKGSGLEDRRSELESFINKNDPYHLLMRQERAFAAGGARLTDDEKRARDDLGTWWAARAFTKDRGLAEAAMASITGAASVAAELLHVQGTCEAALRSAFHWSARASGDVEALTARAEALRREQGTGRALAELAREATSLERMGAAAAAGLLGLLPPGLSWLAGAVDLGALLYASFRTIARVAAVYGIDASSDQGRAFAADAFGLGLSSAGGEGLVAYLSRPKDPAPDAVTVGAVRYAPRWLAGHLWTATGQPARAAAEQLITHTSRLLGLSLTHRQLVAVVPVGGAVVAGFSAASFLADVREAAIHLASRDALLEKLRSDE